ncbi:MAG: hydroxyglutarate oxidase [Chlamydiae bacterium RIFCSPLOWO2_01_FULL_28_7]|nr:MAG: hydroxyglutarate oxidase [Chlamydiae bacterium RIFCSPLOWO2_01_FULL_28_7]
MQKYDCLIVGAGIVGLLAGYKLLKKHPNLKLLILEKESDIATHQTGRNSGVIHSGLYYKPGSLKAKNCIEGRKELIEFCNKFSVPVENCGKIIAATNEDEIKILYDLEKRGKANGIENLKIIDKDEIKEIEPYVNAVKALKVPSCSIVNFKEVCIKVLEEIKKFGGEVILNEKVEKIKITEDSIIITTKHDEFKTKKLINCAGLYSDKIAKMAIPDKKMDMKIIPFRGEYYDIIPEKKHLIKNLIYPVPDPNFPFLGVHLTKMINGNREAGPNAVFAFSKEGYKKTDFNMGEFFESIFYKGFLKIALKHWKMGMFEMYRSFSKKEFLKSVQKFLPDLRMEDIVSGNSGVRAQAIGKNGEMIDDFCILQEQNQIHVLNAPSPAATASFAIGEKIAELAYE